VLRKAWSPGIWRDGHQVLQAHDLADRGGHLRRQARRQRHEPADRRCPAASPGTRRRSGARRAQRRGVMAVAIRRVTSSLSYGMTGSSSNRFSGRSASAHCAPHALSPIRRPARQHVTRSQRRRPGEQRPQIGEGPARAAKRICEGHGAVCRRYPGVASPFQTPRGRPQREDLWFSSMTDPAPSGPQQQPDRRLRILLLRPVSGAIDQFADHHPRARLLLHPFEGTRRLIYPQSRRPDKYSSAHRSCGRQKSSSSAAANPVVVIRYHCSPPWNPVRRYSACRPSERRQAAKCSPRFPPRSASPTRPSEASCGRDP